MFEGTEPRFAGILAAFNIHTSVFWGSRVELYVIAENEFNQVDTIGREFTMTVSQIVAEVGCVRSPAAADAVHDDQEGARHQPILPIMRGIGAASSAMVSASR